MAFGLDDLLKGIAGAAGLTGIAGGIKGLTRQGGASDAALQAIKLYAPTAEQIAGANTAIYGRGMADLAAAPPFPTVPQALNVPGLTMANLTSLQRALGLPRWQFGAPGPTPGASAASMAGGIGSESTAGPGQLSLLSSPGVPGQLPGQAQPITAVGTPGPVATPAHSFQDWATASRQPLVQWFMSMGMDEQGANNAAQNWLSGVQGGQGMPPIPGVPSWTDAAGGAGYQPPWAGPGTPTGPVPATPGAPGTPAWLSPTPMGSDAYRLPQGQIPSTAGLPTASLFGLSRLAGAMPTAVTPEAKDLTPTLVGGTSEQIAATRNVPVSDVERVRGLGADQARDLPGAMLSKGVDYVFATRPDLTDDAARAAEAQRIGRMIQAGQPIADPKAGPGGAPTIPGSPAATLGADLITAARRAAQSGMELYSPLSAAGQQFLTGAMQTGAADPYYQRAYSLGQEKLASDFSARGLFAGGSQPYNRTLAEFTAALSAQQAQDEFQRQQAALGTVGNLAPTLQGMGTTGLNALIRGYGAGQALPQQEATFRLAQTKGQADLMNQALQSQIMANVAVPQSLRQQQLNEALMLQYQLPEQQRQAALQEALTFGFQLPTSLQAQAFAQQGTQAQLANQLRNVPIDTLLALTRAGQTTGATLAQVNLAQAAQAGQMAQLGFGGAANLLSQYLSQQASAPFQQALIQYLTSKAGSGTEPASYAVP